MSKIEGLYDEDEFERLLEKYLRRSDEEAAAARRRAKKDYGDRVFRPPGPRGGQESLEYTVEWSKQRFKGEQ